MRFALRVDSSPKIGMGHLMRCLTLANGLRDKGFECYFICRDFVGNGIFHILDNGFEVERLSIEGLELDHTWLGVPFQQDADDTIKIITKRAADWLIVDHYNIDQQWEAIVQAQFLDMKTLIIDDLVDRPHSCDILIDQTYGRYPEEYEELVSENSKLCLGTEYALLRRNFKKLREQKENLKTPQNKPCHILITLGGGDSFLPIQVIGKALKQISSKNSFSLTVITGSTPKHLLSDYETLDQEVEYISFSKSIDLEMAKADFVIGAGGGTSWERCCMGLPTIVLTIADNQIEIVKILSQKNAGISVKTDAEEIAKAVETLLHDEQLLQEMSKNAASLCDGNGVARGIQQILVSSFNFKLATLDDAKFIYDARYEDCAAKFYRNKDVPSFKSHVDWLENALTSDERILANVFLGEEKIAHLRIDKDLQDHSIGEISICLSANWRGKGLGKAVLKSANQYFSKSGYSKIYAEVHENNLLSARIFEEVGYAYVSADSDGFIRYLWQE